MITYAEITGKVLHKIKTYEFFSKHLVPSIKPNKQDTPDFVRKIEETKAQPLTNNATPISITGRFTRIPQRAGIGH